jgi:antitoxin component of RelBE/YafQ-DinJ toxin-antitoxin module
MKIAQFHMRMDSELKKEAQEYAAKTGRTLPGLIDWLLRKHLESAKNEKPR